MKLEFHTAEKVKTYRKKLKQHHLNNLIDDEDAVNQILSFLFEFDQKSEKSVLMGKEEDEITDDIRDWLDKYEDFNFSGFKVDSQVKNRNRNQEGYYDLKFQHSDWEGAFYFECKRMDETKTMTTEYVYRPATERTKADGGLYRFLINKYADANKDFGGMIGFVIKGAVKNVIDNVKDKISDLKITENKIKFGQSTNPKLLEQTISGNKNTFLSQHVRCDKTVNKIISPVLIYHIFFDFTQTKKNPSGQKTNAKGVI